MALVLSDLEALGVSVLLCFSSLLLSVCWLPWLPPLDSLALEPAPEAALDDML